MFSNNNSGGTVTFNLQNTNTTGVIITGINGLSTTAGSQAVSFYYKATPVSGQPVAIDGANGWTLISSGTITSTGSTSVLQPFFTGLNFTLPAGATYGFAVSSPSQPYYSITTSGTVTISAGGVNFLSGDNIGYGGGTPPAAPTFTPRGWIGEITFVPAGPCTSPPTAGITTTSTTNICSGGPISLGLSGNSFGTGQTYQWQTAPAATGPWTNLGTASAVPSYSATATVTQYYRAAVTCGTQTSYSTAVQVTVPPAFPGGTYTINNAVATGGTNFQTFAAAIAAISCGTTSSVVFNVSPGIYNEQVDIPAIFSTSATNTITFNGNGATVTDTINVSTSAPHSFMLSGADYIRVNNLNMVAAGTYGLAGHLWNGSDNNIFTNCTFSVPANNTSSLQIPFSISGSATSGTSSGVAGNNNLITGCTINSGYYNTCIVSGNNNSVVNSFLKDFYYYGAYLSTVNGVTFTGNSIERPTRTNPQTYYGMYLSGVTNALIEKNKFHDPFGGALTTSGTAYGIYTFSTPTVGNENKIYNNLIYDMKGTVASVYGIYLSGAGYTKMYHNTVSLDYTTATSGTAYGIYSTAATGVEVINNIVSINRGGTGTKYCLYYSGGTQVSNNNDLYNPSTTGTNGVGYYGNTYATLATWKTANGGAWDQLSYDANPTFANVATGNFAPTSGAMDNIGAPLGVTTDLLNATRSTTTPDVGAYEFTGPACTSPPTAGTISSSVGASACANTNVTFSLSGNSVGSAQTYQLQSSTTSTGTFTNVGTASQNVNTTITASSTLWYRMAVTCGASTVYTAPIQLLVPVNFPAGTYTINSATPTGGTNFQTFAAAVSAIKCGIAGPIVFNVVAGSGPYNEQIEIPQISNMSAVNTVTINGNGATLTYGATLSGSPHTLSLNGADYFRFNNLNIAGTGATYALVGHLWNNADNDSFINCTFTAPANGTASGQVPFSISGDAANATSAGNAGINNVLVGCSMNNGYYNTVLYGNSTTPSTANKIINCNLKDFYSYGLYTLYQSGLVFSGNNIERPTRTSLSSAFCIYLSSAITGALIEKNKIHGLFATAPTNTNSVYGIYSFVAGTLGNENKIYNNLIYDIRNNSSIYAMYLSGANYTKIYHNSVILNDPDPTTTSTTYGLYNSGTTGTDIRNNIVMIARGGTGSKYCLYYGSAPQISNNNDLFQASPAGTANYTGYYLANFLALSDWQTANAGAWDQASVALDPLFTNLSIGNAKPTNISLDNKGVNVGVLDDINNSLRVMPTPDMGAVEFGSDCPAVSNLAASPVAGTTATITWTAPAGGAQGYQYVLDQVSTNPGGNGSSTTATTYSAINLRPLTTYYFHIRVLCPINGYSYWNTISFNTPCVNPSGAIRLSGDSLICPNQPITLSTDTLYAPTHQWNLNGTAIPGATQANYTTATPGVYTVTSTLGTCIKTSNSVRLTVDSQLTARISYTGSNSTCMGGSITLRANTGAGYNYQWLKNGNAIPLATSSTYVAEYSGIYRVRITSSAPCPALSDTVVITVHDSPYPQITRVGNVLSTTSSFATYQWYRNAALISGATASTYTFSHDGTYSVKVTDVNSCNGTSSNYQVNYLGVGNVQASDISIYPNPASDVITVASPIAVNVEIRSMDGKVVLKAENAKTIDIHALTSGMYLLYVTNKDQEVLKIEKLIKATH